MNLSYCRHHLQAPHLPQSADRSYQPYRIGIILFLRPHLMHIQHSNLHYLCSAMPGIPSQAEPVSFPGKIQRIPCRIHSRRLRNFNIYRTFCHSLKGQCKFCLFGASSIARDHHRTVAPVALSPLTNRSIPLS